MTQRAIIKTGSAFLSTEFGENMARRYFGDKVEQLGRFSRGKRAGKLRGQIVWKKVIKGGWVSTGPTCADGVANGYVENRVNSVIEVHLMTSPWGEHPETIESFYREKN